MIKFKRIKLREDSVVYIIIKVSFIFYIPLIMFFSGLNFEKWGGFTRLVPAAITFLRNNIFGDKFVLLAERKFFSFNDFLKKTLTIKPDEEKKLKDKITDKDLNPAIVNLKKEYVKDHTAFTENDFQVIKQFSEFYYGRTESVFNNPIELEGIWEKHFISPETLKPLYAKTFIRPDKERSYVKAFIYKYDMDRLNIEFIPGFKDTEESWVTGKMTDKQKEKVLWIFSGGFQYRHGKFGMKYNNKVLLPPREGLQTIFFYNNGTFEIKEWTKDTVDSDDFYAFRQNELPLITNCQTNADIQYYWGYTPGNDDPIYTVRSGMGVTKYNELVFAFGKDLSAKTLSIALIKAGVVTGMHLDMNSFNVHFIRIERGEDGSLKTANENDVLTYFNKIYLEGSPRDYFIITQKD